MFLLAGLIASFALAGPVFADDAALCADGANFYSGVLALRQDNKDDAIRLLRLAAKQCPRVFEEQSAAQAELKLLGAAL